MFLCKSSVKKLFSKIFHFVFVMFLFVPPAASSQPQCEVDCHSNGNLVLGGDQLKADRPLIGKSDFADVVSPAPVLSYTPLRFAQRLIEMAEGSPPIKEDFEREFGVKLVLVNKVIDGDGFAYIYRGYLPDSKIMNKSENVGFNDGNKNLSVFFSFQEIIKNGKKLCIPRSHVFKYFDANWVRYGLPDPLAFNFRRYFKKIDGVAKMVDIYPSEESAVGCVREFGLSFGVH